MQLKLRLILMMFCLSILTGCAILGEVIHTPQITVAEVKSQWITPTQWKLICPILVKNPNPLSLAYAQIVYTITVNNKQINTKILSDLPVIPSYEKFTYEIPILITMDSLKSALLPNDKTITFTISGQLFPVNSEEQVPSSFNAQSTYTLPAIPTVTCKQLKKSKTGFSCLVEFKNHQLIAMKIIRIDGYCQTGNLKLNFTPLSQPISVNPEETKRLLLNAPNPAMIQVPGNSPILISGEIELETEIGKIIIPFQQEHKGTLRL